MEEYMDGAFLSATSTMVAFSFTVLILKIESLFKFMDSSEKVVESSEYYSQISSGIP